MTAVEHRVWVELRRRVAELTGTGRSIDLKPDQWELIQTTLHAVTHTNRLFLRFRDRYQDRMVMDEAGFPPARDARPFRKGSVRREISIPNFSYRVAYFVFSHASRRPGSIRLFWAIGVPLTWGPMVDYTPHARYDLYGFCYAFRVPVPSVKSLHKPAVLQEVLRGIVTEYAAMDTGRRPAPVPRITLSVEAVQNLLGLNAIQRRPDNTLLTHCLNPAALWQRPPRQEQKQGVLTKPCPIGYFDMYPGGAPFLDPGKASCYVPAAWNLGAKHAMAPPARLEAMTQDLFSSRFRDRHAWQTAKPADTSGEYRHFRCALL